MDPNSSLGKICLGDEVIIILSDKIKGSGDWDSPEYQNTTGSKGKKVMNTLSFYKMETDKISKRYIAPCFMNGLEAYDGKINLAFDENLISNEFSVKLYLDYKVRKRKKLVKKELTVTLKGELYFVKFIINPEEDDVEPGVILGRSFLRLAKGIVDFGNEVITIYPEPDPFEEYSEKTGKSSDDWDQLLDFNFDDMPKVGEELPSFVCKMGKSNRIKKRAMENMNQFYPDIGPSLSTGRHLTQGEAEKEALAIRINQKFALLEEERPVIETMAYHDKYKKILDEIWKDKVELDGKIMKEDEEAVKRIKGEALKEKEDPGDFIFPIILEKKTEAIGKFSNVLCQVGVTTVIAKFLILDISIDRDSPIVVGRGFLRTIGRMINTSKRILSTFDGFCHQTLLATRSNYMRNTKSDSDDEEEYVIKRNNFRAPIYSPRPAPYLNCTNPEDHSSAIQTVTNPFRKISVWKKAVSFLGLLPVPLKQVNWKPKYKVSYTKEEEATGQWRTEIRVTDPYGNIYLQGFTIKNTDWKMSKYHKLSDIMSPNWFTQ
ncbi:hypothetical protein Tco_1068641 [Tanacetum coccineum]|uniref:Uncharacterized protein n=1 Tax=Tanacetum coccineum TaxID=301880 RepID=A0ABQ5HHR0_9ASTR